MFHNCLPIISILFLTGSQAMAKDIPNCGHENILNQTIFKNNGLDLINNVVKSSYSRPNCTDDNGIPSKKIQVNKGEILGVTAEESLQKPHPYFDEKTFSYKIPNFYSHVYIEDKNNPEFHFYGPLVEKLASKDLQKDKVWSAVKTQLPKVENPIDPPLKNGDCIGLMGNRDSMHVDVYVNNQTYTMMAKTRANHMFHDGLIQRSLIEKEDGYYIVTIGVGVNKSEGKARLNEKVGATVWIAVNEKIRDYLLSND